MVLGVGLKPNPNHLTCVVDQENPRCAFHFEGCSGVPGLDTLEGFPFRQVDTACSSALVALRQAQAAGVREAALPVDGEATSSRHPFRMVSDLTLEIPSEMGSSTDFLGGAKWISQPSTVVPSSLKGIP